MKLSDLHEMALRGGNLSAIANAWAVKLQADALKHLGDHQEIGKIDDLIVRKKLFTTTIWNGDVMVLAAQVDIVPNAYCMVDDVWVAPSARGQKLFSKFLIFLKVKLKQPKIVFGEVHSDDTYQLLKADGFKLFKKRWENFHGDVAEFSPDTVDQFYGAGRWKLVLENTDDLSSYLIEDSFTHSYDALVHIVNTYQSI